MGSGISSPVKPDKCIEGSGEASIGVKKEDKDMKMIVELLSNPITCKHFSRFAKSLGRYNMIQCWFRLQECMEERGNLSVYRVSNLCGECYLAATSLRSMDSIDHLKSLLVGYKSQNSGADRYLESMTGKLRSVLNSLMYICLNCLVEDVYYSGYEQLVMDDDALCGDSDGSKHNASYFSYDTQYKDPNEFIFLSVLSVRETSLTFHCVKRGFSSKINASSTRQKWGSFALKVTPKASVLRKYWQDPESIVDGLTGIYKKVNHPFLSPLLESFQSPNFLFLVVPIAECGNLASSLSAQPGGTMKCSRVRFYAAEMVSALCYLHERGYCCRILKPSTVLLNSNGHIMLTDYGCIKGLCIC